MLHSREGVGLRAPAARKNFSVYGRRIRACNIKRSYYQAAARIADAVLTGQMPDLAATHFLNPTVVRQRRGGSLPSWARGEGQSIGRHTFYSPDEIAAVQASLSMSALGDSLGSEKSASCEDGVDEAVNQSRNLKHDG